MDLLALADFNLVARHGGFGRAARAADRPKATLSRRVGELEASLGVRLFERGSHTLKLTEEGRAPRRCLPNWMKRPRPLPQAATRPVGGCA